MAAQQGSSSSPLRALEEALGMGVSAGGDASDASEGTYYLEQVTITEASEDDYEYEEIPDDNFSIPEGEEDLAKAIEMTQEKVTDTQILEQKTVLPPKPAVPEVIEDFLCNFLIRMGMTRTLDCFQSEWYELIQKGITKNGDDENVPDVYTQNMLLDNENKNLKKDLKHCKQAADKAREDLLKTQKERDFHRMHHRRIVQEKNKLINELKGLKLHYASYEPAIRVLLDKHHTLLRQKMLTCMEKDRIIEQISGLRTSLKPVERGHSFHAASIRVIPGNEKEDAVEGPTQRALREAREQNKYKAGMKDNRKDSEFPTDIQPNLNLYFRKGKDGPPKFDYTLSTIFRLHELPVSCIVVHPFKDILVSCGEDHLWKAVALPKGNVLLTGVGHTDWLSSCCLHPSGNKLATSSGDTTVKLWDLSKGKCILTFEGHKHAVWSCTWHTCGDFVASSSLDTTSKIWDVNRSRDHLSCITSPQQPQVILIIAAGHSWQFPQCLHKQVQHAVIQDISPSKEVPSFQRPLFPAQHSSSELQNTNMSREGKCEQSLYGHMHSINDATFAPKGHMIASCDSFGVIKLWDFRKLLPIVSIDVGPSPGNEVNFDSSGQVLAQASGSGVIHLLDLQSGQIYKLVGHDNEAHTVVFSRDGESLFSGGSDGTVRIWS